MKRREGIVGIESGDPPAESAVKTFQQYLFGVTDCLLQVEFGVAEVIAQYEVEQARFAADGSYRTDTQPNSQLHERLQRAVADGWPSATIRAALSAEIDRLSTQTT
jgi:hypothetical protein